MTTKTAMTYTVFGVSFYRGAHRLRFSNDLAARMKTLLGNGDEEINMVELPSAMSKMQAVQWAQASGQFETEAEKAVIAGFIEKNNKVESAEPKKRGRPRKAADVAVTTLGDVAATAEADAEIDNELAELASQNVDVDAEELLDSIEGNEELSDDELLAQLAAEEELEADVA